MIFLKDSSVNLSGVEPEMFAATSVVASVFAAAGVDTVLTSANDGVHTGLPVAGGTKDPHYEGKAIDFRLRHLRFEDVRARAGVVAAITDKLGAEFFVTYEDPGGPNEHCHVQHGHVAA